MTIAIDRIATPTEEAAALIAELDGVLGGVYTPEQRHGLSLEEVFQPQLRFFIAFGHYRELPACRIAASLFFEMPLQQRGSAGLPI